MSFHESALRALHIVQRGAYEVAGRTVRFAAEQAAAVARTRHYTPADCAALAACPAPAPEVQVVAGTTQEVAGRLAATSAARVSVLNFASAVSPGGGFLRGARAQEEDLCRCSGLYPCLVACKPYYDANCAHDSSLYTDHAIFSPAVPFFRVHDAGSLLTDPFFVAVITAPAPHSEWFLRDQPGATDALAATFLRRWRNVLRIARHQGTQTLVLGAWGCGAFGGDPRMASATAQQALAADGGGIARVVFAIPRGNRQSDANLAAFEATFGAG